jgi:hypothetical protein
LNFHSLAMKLVSQLHALDTWQTAHINPQELQATRNNSLQMVLLT